MAVSRRTVTVLFADVADSTPLGERLDPETLRLVMSRWFERMSEVLERHGGTVEKFIGDAVMAVFGIPDLHEDDGLRAVRAATELRSALARLNEELEGELGVHIGIRVGVNTGEVVAGDGTGGQMLVTGDPVNVAKRLEEAARTGEILIGDGTRVASMRVSSGGPRSWARCGTHSRARSPIARAASSPSSAQRESVSRDSRPSSPTTFAAKRGPSRAVVSRTATASPSGRSSRSSARSAATRAFASCWAERRTGSSLRSEC